MALAIPQVDTNLCVGCCDCVNLCPCHVVELVGGKASIVRPDECDYCADCEIFCSSGAMKVPFEIVLEIKT